MQTAAFVYVQFVCWNRCECATHPPKDTRVCFLLFLLFRSMLNDTFVRWFTLCYFTIFIIIIRSIWSWTQQLSACIALSKNTQIRNVEELFPCSFIDISVMIAKIIALLLLSREFRRSDFAEHAKKKNCDADKRVGTKLHYTRCTAYPLGWEILVVWIFFWILHWLQMNWK